jgi:hypothetical protein
MRAWLSGGPLAGAEVLVGDGATAVSYPIAYSSGYKALVVRYVRSAKHGFEWDGVEGVVIDTPKPTAEKRTLSIMAKARIRAALAAKALKAPKGTLTPIAACSVNVNGNMNVTGSVVDCGESWIAANLVRR